MSICKVHVPGDCAGNCEQPATGAGRSLVETLRMHRTNWRASDLLEPPSAIDLADRIDVLAELMLKGGDNDG